MNATISMPELEREAPPDDTRFEVVDGLFVEKPPLGTQDGIVVSNVLRLIGAYAVEKDLGVTAAEILFQLDEIGRRLRPDVAFVSFDRWPRNRVMANAAWEVAPDVAIEVASPGNTADEVPGKVRLYFRAGVRQCWWIFPRDRSVYVYHAPNQVQVFDRDETLVADDVFPGLALPVAEFFLYLPDLIEPAPDATVDE